MNNSLVHLLVTAGNSGSLEGTLGDNMLTSIKTGNAITTALVIAMFIYLFVKLNIKFIVRQFTIIIFTIFTPIAARSLDNQQKCNSSKYLGRSNHNEYFYAVYILLFIFDLSCIFTKSEVVGQFHLFGL